jgi:chromosome segregation ATPase
MATPGDDHETRIRVLEEKIEDLRGQIARARSDAAAARVLAGGADKDVADMRAELRAHTKALNALRETQIEQGQEISDLRTEMRVGFAKVDAGFAEMHSKFSILHDGIERITRLLTRNSPNGRD